MIGGNDRMAGNAHPTITPMPLFVYACSFNTYLDGSYLQRDRMDSSHLFCLDVCGCQRLASLALAILWDAASLNQRHVRLHLAFF